MKRLLFGTLLAIGLTLLGFGLALLLAVEYVYPGSSELGRGLARLSFAMGGAIVGFAAGILLGFVLNPAHLPRAALAALVLGGVTFGVVAWRSAQQKRAAAVAKTTPPPLPGPGRDMLQGLVTVRPEMLSHYETREHAYEEKSVTVYARNGDWYLVGLSDGGRAWLNSRETDRFLPLAELVVNRNNYLTAAWDTRIRDVPDESAPSRVAPAPESARKEFPAKVLEAREAGGTLWLKVEVLERSPCEGGTPQAVASGWIPAWGHDRKPTAWFYSRGC